MAKPWWVAGLILTAELISPAAKEVQHGFPLSAGEFLDVYKELGGQADKFEACATMILPGLMCEIQTSGGKLQIRINDLDRVYAIAFKIPAENYEAGIQEFERAIRVLGLQNLIKIRDLVESVRVGKPIAQPVSFLKLDVGVDRNYTTLDLRMPR